MGKNQYLENRSSTRKKLRIIGITLIIIGVILFVLSIIFMTNNNKQGFLLSFIGVPVLFIGGVCTLFGFMGAVSRYSVSESAPIISDTKNFMEEQTRLEKVKTISEVSNQLHNERKINCFYCKAEVPSDAKYCTSCGKMLVKVCSCGTENPSDAFFCKSCGKSLRNE